MSIITLAQLELSLRRYERRNLLRWVVLSLFGFAEPENQRITLLRDFLRQIPVESEVDTRRIVTRSEFFDFVRTQTRFLGLDPEQLFNAEYLNGPQKSATLVFKSFLDNSEHFLPVEFKPTELKFPELKFPELKFSPLKVPELRIDPDLTRILDETRREIDAGLEKYHIDWGESLIKPSYQAVEFKGACRLEVRFTSAPSTGLVVAAFEGIRIRDEVGSSAVGLGSGSIGGSLFLRGASEGEGLTISPLTETPALSFVP